MAQFGVPNPLVNPVLNVVRISDGTIVAANMRWNSASNAEQIRAVRGPAGAFPLAEDSADCAVLVDLGSDNYTAVISGLNGSAGTVLAEVYDLSGSDPLDVQLVNLSTRAVVEGNQNPMIGGFVVQGNSPRTVLIRAVGPNLPGITNRLANPNIRLLKKNGDNWDEVAVNEDWGTPASAAPAIRGFSASVGAFAIPDGSQDAVILRSLSPGLYTIQVFGAPRLERRRPRRGLSRSRLIVDSIFPS